MTRDHREARIADALRIARGNKAKAARIAGVSESTVERWVRKREARPDRRKPTDRLARDFGKSAADERRR
jgi:hypothetical protein